MTQRRIINQEIQDSFHWIDLSLQDFRKVLSATDNIGNGANFLAALCGLAITEIIAKLYAPYTTFKTHGKSKRIVRIRKITLGGNIAKPDTLESIDAKPAVYTFYKHCFTNRRYAKLTYFIWEVFRNGHVHLFRPKRINNIPIPEFDNSSASGVKWDDIGILEERLEYRQIVENIHLKFTKTLIKGKERPVFTFSPHIYYFDLCKAVRNFKTQLNINQSLRIRFHKAHQLLMQAKNLDFLHGKIRDTEREIIKSEIKKLI